MSKLVFWSSEIASWQKQKGFKKRALGARQGAIAKRATELNRTKKTKKTKKTIRRQSINRLM